MARRRSKDIVLQIGPAAGKSYSPHPVDGTRAGGLSLRLRGGAGLVVDQLEKDGQGLNLTLEVRDGILKHSKGKGAVLSDNPNLKALTLEGQTVRLAKRLLREAQHSRLSDVLELSAAFQALAHETRDHKEAVDAFTEKRAPKFTGE